jgi:hypothetical protein
MMQPVTLTVSGSIGVSTAVQLDYLRFGAFAVQTTCSSTTSVYSVEASLDPISTGMVWVSVGASTLVGNSLVTGTAPYRYVRVNVTTGASEAVTTVTVVQSG